EGRPDRGVKVEAVRTEGAGVAHSVSDAKGRFELRDLPAGAFTLRVASPRGPVVFGKASPFMAAGGSPLTNLELRLPPAGAKPDRPPTENRVLALDGSGAHVNLPLGMFSNLRETTIEAWVRF